MRRNKEVPLLPYQIPEDINVWRRAVYSALMEDGLDYFYIHIRYDESGEYAYRYSWGLNHDSGFNPDLPLQKPLWKKFHQAMVVCERLRPNTLRPSRALLDILEKEGYFT